jgi:hypothetical protein
LFEIHFCCFFFGSIGLGCRLRHLHTRETGLRGRGGGTCLSLGTQSTIVTDYINIQSQSTG